MPRMFVGVFFLIFSKTTASGVLLDESLMLVKS